MMTSRARNRMEYPIKKDINCEREELEFCVICCSQVESGDVGNITLLCKNLAVIFLLRKVLQVPDCQLEENLRECGDPVKWIRLCEQCRQLTGQAEDLHQQIVKIERELKSIQNLIVERVKSSSSSSQSSRMNRKSVWMSIREFAVKCPPSRGSEDLVVHVNPFIEGDKLAGYLLNQQRSQSPSNPVSFVVFDKQGDLETETGQDAISSASPPFCQNIKLEVEAEDDTIVEDDWSQEDNEDERADEVEIEVKFEITTEESGQMVCSRRSNERLTGYKKKKRIRVNGKWKCRYCDKLFVGVSTCYLHENEKHIKLDSPLKCDICGKAWNSKAYYNQHRRNVHGINPDGSTVPIKLMEGQSNLEDSKAGISKKQSLGLSSISSMRKRRNQKMIRINGKLKCRYCDKVFGAMSTCLLHEKEKHPRIPGQFPCDICGKPWNSRDYLRDHRRSVHGITPDGTQLMIVKKKRLNKSKVPVEGEKNKVKLRKISNRSSGLWGVGRNQRKAEKIDGKWKCRHCDQMFGASSSCYLHEREKHASRPGEYICDICGKVWNSRDYLRDHRRRIHGVNPDGSEDLSIKKKWEIKLGGDAGAKKERKIRKLSRSSRADLGTKRKKIKMEQIDGKWKCRHCDQVFGAKSSCYLHEREKHAENIGQFICDICGKTWNSRDYLRDHRRSTHGINPDGLPVTTGKVKMKMKAEKTKCRHCDKVFSTRRTCNFHEKEKHAENSEEQLFICDICGKGWNTQEYFRKHRIKHKINSDDDGTPNLSPKKRSKN